MRFDGVQALRFGAALLVVITHSTWYASQRLDTSGGYFWFGAVGVDIFFVISGFVMMVSSPSFSRDPLGAARFGYRRIIRIAPMYWIATTVKIATLLILPAAAVNAALSPERVLTSYFFLPTRSPDGDTGVLLGVGWTLLFEMLFYLVFTIGLALRVSPYLFSSAVLAVFAVGGYLRPPTWPVWEYHFNPIVLYFVIGMTFGKLVMSVRWRPWAGRVALGLVGLSLLIAVVPGGFSWGSHSPLRMVSVSALVMCVIAAEPFLHRVLVPQALFLGDASYSIYLFHPLIAPLVPVALARAGLIDNRVAAVLSVLVSIGTAAVIYQLVERPLTRTLRHNEHRVVHSRAPEPAADLRADEPAEADVPDAARPAPVA
ncbi:acyltransferase family protein [Cellulomonas fengjieae]|uniref:Acyltransferase n=1 Tax=Cellulomonas fengjieae TaxID=2819978 RepID=A0ABS3SLB7_9CELL|nr:acyltransferase [Cellulomonas fengjieae]MBO3086536.1 acyltransferase [Cellulomonas fengjieae]MBO3100532.1 acyltransferase [Cellulomonas fengjieae]QVI66607.1 acyltransferase [Cellulomonas fengjieae]